MTTSSVDVVIVGAGPSGAVAAHTLASRGFSVVCLEQGDWVNPTELPGSKPEFELLTRRAWHWEPNVRGRRDDYPLDTDDTNAPVSMFGAVGGSSVVYGRALDAPDAVGLPAPDPRRRGRRLADRVRRPRQLLRPRRRPSSGSPVSVAIPPTRCRTFRCRPTRLARRACTWPPP